jgi:predicted XRE-type DNA-binding protein
MRDEAMKNDMTVKRSRGNIFADIGLPDAENHKLKAQIVAAISNQIRKEKLTQTAAAERIGLKQPDVSKLLDGRFEGFSLERLLSFLLMLGNDVTIDIAPTNDNNDSTARGHLKLALA